MLHHPPPTPSPLLAHGNIPHTFVVSFQTALAQATSQGLANPFLSLVQRFLKLFCFRFLASILYFNNLFAL
jgi:hypothetical protein